MVGSVPCPRVLSFDQAVNVRDQEIVPTRWENKDTNKKKRRAEVRADETRSGVTNSLSNCEA